MKRILQVVNIMDRAGLETMLMNYYRNINRSEIQFDFLTHRDVVGEYDEEIKCMGGKIYRAPRLMPQNYFKYIEWMKNFFKEHPEYTIVHSHIDAMSFWPLWAAKSCGISVRIAHSHNTRIDKDYKYILKCFFKKLLPSVANYYWACGDQAGKFLFGEREFDVLPNAIEAERFLFQSETRDRVREELNIVNSFVIGHVGRFFAQKNHKFLIETFSEIKKMRSDAVLLLVGQGELEQGIKELCKYYNIVDSVKFLGSRSDVNTLLQAMDVFVLPSLFEGLPVVGVEAQASGLPCVFSDCVPEEVGMTGNCVFLPLEIGPAKWAEQIISLKCENRQCENEIIRQKGYDIKLAANNLMDKYKKMM